MQKLQTREDLGLEIQKLELQNAQELNTLKGLVFKEIENIQPFALIKKKIRESVNNPDFLSNILTATIGLATGFLVKKIVQRASHNPLFLKLLGLATELTTAKAINSQPIESKSKIIQFLKRIWHN